MKFILTNDGVEAVNSAFVKKFFVTSDTRRGENGRPVTVGQVRAEFADGKILVIKDFNVGGIDENFIAAEKYLSELVGELNGGSK